MLDMKAPLTYLTAMLLWQLSHAATAAGMDRAAEPRPDTTALRTLIDNGTLQASRLPIKRKPSRSKSPRRLHNRQPGEYNAMHLQAGARKSHHHIDPNRQQVSAAAHHDSGHDQEDDDDDDHLPRSGKGGSSSSSSSSSKSSKSSKSAKSGRGDNGDTGDGGDDGSGGDNGNGSGDDPETPVFLMFNGYVDTSVLANPLVPDPSSTEPNQPGTTVVFANERIFTVFNNEVMGNSGLAQGQCIRIDPNPVADAENYEGRGYCQMTLEFFAAGTDPPEVLATVSVEGPIDNMDDSKLVVTSGTGALFGATGDAIISPATVNDGMLSDSARDFLDLPSDDGFEVRIEVAVMPRFELGMQDMA